MVVHPAPGNYSGTLVNALLYKYDLSKGESSFRPGIVHRIDKDTSGLMVVAKEEKTHELLSDMFKNKEVKREYIAIVDGVINHEKGTIDAPIGRDKANRQKMAVTDVNGKESITHFEVLKRFSNNTLVRCILDTGRTHQIRVHFAYINHPVTNDPLYGKEKIEGFGQFLHSTSIDFIHPFTRKHIHYEVAPPKEFDEYINNLE
jgi:23S rRNA pseudouridine1911/1915/1917 synthase